LAASLLVSWREGVAAEREPDGGLRVLGDGSRLRMRRLSPRLTELLLRLEPPGSEADTLAEDAANAGVLAEWYYRLQELTSRRLVVRSVWDEGRRLATLVPISAGCDVSVTPRLDGNRAVVLSRFAYLHRDRCAAVIESPQAPARVVLDDVRTAALLVMLAVPHTCNEIARHAEGLSPEAVTILLQLLDGAGMLQRLAPDGTENETAALRTWEFHDLLFHARSREGRTDAPHGGTYRFPAPPAPALDNGRLEDVRTTIPLARPDLALRERDDPPLALVLRERRSIRQYGARPITAAQLGEFLYRVARVIDRREVERETPHGPVRMEFATRPYPSGGALYELEFYAGIQSCEGLNQGLYHYDPLGHAIGTLPTRPADLAGLLTGAAASADIAPESLQVLFVLAARVPRIAWKYESIAYALVLKHVGVVYQTMYLAATAMGLAPCALGCGDSDLFSRTSGKDYYEETSVGEFLLGSL
jgi:SagB-type dehydrogenase family enzyme